MVLILTGQVNDMALKTINTIKTSGARLLNLINDILDAASMRKVCVRAHMVAEGGRVSIGSPCSLTSSAVTLLPILCSCTDQTLFPNTVFRDLQGKLTIKQEKVNLPRAVDDVVELCQTLVCLARVSH